MNSNRYAAAGWAAILSAAGTLGVLGLSFVFDLSRLAEGPRGFTPVAWTGPQVALVAGVDAVAWALGSPALAAVGAVVVVSLIFAGLLRLGPPTQWFS